MPQSRSSSRRKTPVFIWRPSTRQRQKELKKKRAKALTIFGAALVFWLPSTALIFFNQDKFHRHLEFNLSASTVAQLLNDFVPESLSNNIPLNVSDSLSSDSQDPELSQNTTATITAAPKIPEQNIFYHAYINPENPQLALDIIKEQLEQVGAATHHYLSTNLYYNTVGQPLEDKFMEKLCNDNGIICHHLKHYEDGFERVTHTDLQHFCARNAQSTVTYMHSKGSFHPKGTNDNLRRGMTAGVLSPQCHQAFAKNMCNTCGLTFAPEKFSFFPGNFWMAQCQYVNRLLAPTNYEKEATAVAKEALYMRSTKQLTMDIFADLPTTLGLNRYASEFWIASHPTVQPCALSRRVYNYWLMNVASERHFHIDKAPRRELNEQFIPKTLRNRKREYFLLAGYVLRWQHFYGMVPPADSWYWTYFPDGPLWRSVSKQHGKEAVHEVTKGFTYA